MAILQLKQKFARADPRFGPVPFWWWSADTVTAERVCWQLKKFRAGGLRNIGIINLAPTGPQYGSISDFPAYASEEWWQLFEVAVREAERLGMYVWFYDQIGFSGSNMPARIVTERPEYAGYQLRRFGSGEELPAAAEVLYETGETVYAAVRQGFNWLDPQAAAELIGRVHGEMERRFACDLGRTIAGSFQDELPPLPLWTPQLAEMYRERHREELFPLLPALFDPLPGAADVRRRVYRLAAELAEQAFFIPLADWHRRHGLLIGCDQAGPARRADPHGAQRLYLDYFRTHRWYNAPGSDMDGEIKPHSSMVHLHGGSRVWLEGFHSSGWGGTLEETMHWLLPWFQAGATLYSPHAVYYSTKGGWWEWAPPDTGWRQPYFEHYPVFADTVSRICSLLSEGAHVCDVAVHYPSHAVCGHLSLNDGKKLEHPMSVSARDPNETVARIQRVYRDIAAGWSRRDHKTPGALRKARIDFDIADDAALLQSVPESRQLRIADERFSALLLCGTTVMEEGARARVKEWIGQGGLVVAVEVPEGERDLEGVEYVATAEEAAAVVAARLPRRVEGPGATLHRRTAEADIFLLLPEDGGLLWMHEPSSPGRHIPESAVYRLKTAREPELWDPVSGRTERLPYRRSGEWIELEVPFAAWPAALVVCCDKASSTETAAEAEGGEPSASGPFPATTRPAPSSPRITLSLEDWQVHPVATLDNRYGDFDLHIGENSGCPLMPVERRMMRVRPEIGDADGERAGWERPDYDDSGWPELLWSEAVYWRVCKGERYDDSQSQPVVYSNTFGDMAMRSWAGRMGRVPRRFLNLGQAAKGEYVWAKTYVMAPERGRYWMRTESNADIAGWVNGAEISFAGGREEQTAWIELAAGTNELLLRACSVSGGLLRAAVEVNSVARPPLPKWLYTVNPNLASSLAKTLTCPADMPFRRVRIVFAARGRAALLVNGVRVTEHGDFNPYIRQGQEEVDVTPLWRTGDNEVKILLPEGKGEVFADGIIELQNGDVVSFCTGTDWRDETGCEPGIHHFSVLQFAETESLWICPRPHPLPGIGWLMPEHVPAPAPLPFLADPGVCGRPVWLRFPLPVGATRMRIACAGRMRVWIAGEEVPVQGGAAEFAPQPAGTMAAVRVEPDGVLTEAAVLLAPIRFDTVPFRGKLGDWRTALCLPHHSGAVEYATTVETPEIPGAVLDLGYVKGTAEAWLDGKPLGVRLWQPYRFDLGGPLAAGKHRLRVRVTNTLGAHYEIGRPTSLVGGNPDVTYWNRGRAAEEEEWRQWFAAGGMYGPATIAGGDLPAESQKEGNEG